MSTNHYSMNHLPETTLWWTQQQQQQQQHHQPIQPSWFNLNNNQNDIVEDDLETQENEDENIATTTTENLEENKEPMFEKPLTPSDVGKLNRLVIPKQHAEKYFPLGASSSDTSSECKGLLLSFEDESGKCWRFRYSYWNSSQSYVLTKGWSRYVKDKRLDAGDVVLFERHRVDTQRLFINWRRRRVTGTEVAHVSNSRGYGKNGSDGILSSNVNKNEGGVGVGWTRGFYSAHPYPAHHHHHLSPYHQQHDHCLHAGRGSQQQQQGGQNQMTKPVGNNSSSSSNSSSNSKVLRLFGVNMECQSDQQHSNSSYDGTTTTTTDHPLYYYHHQPSSNSNSHPHVVRHQPYYY